MIFSKKQISFNKIHKFLGKLLLVSCSTALFVPTLVSAQGFGMNPGMGGQKGPGKKEKDMVIKKAEGKKGEKTPEIHKDNYLDKPPSMQFFSLDGYFRLRNDYMYRYDLGYRNYSGVASPHRSPLLGYLEECSQSDPSGNCKGHNVTSTNMRLRLNPVLRPSESVAIYSTLDVLDNLVLGSTPYGMNYQYGSSGHLPYAGFSANQSVYQDGSNSNWDAIRVKNLWGKVDLQLFDLSFGRMPNHFGMGLYHNNGFGLDADYGDSVDRIQLSSTIPAFELQLGASWDFASQGFSSVIVDPEADQGQPKDMDDMDDSTRWTFYLMKKYSPVKTARKLKAGNHIFNYGLNVGFNRHRYGMPAMEYSPLNSPTISSDNELSELASYITPRYAFYTVPDFWMLYAKGNFRFEMEVVGKYGWITKLNDVDGMSKEGNDMNILSLGGVMRMNYRYSKEVTLGVEFGYASGDDQYENIENKGSTHYSNLPAYPVNPNDKYNSLFLFHPSFHVDMLFFRELMGTVYNSSYAKLSFKYKTGRWKFGIDGILPMANEPVATPGNSRLYGAELDGFLNFTSKDNNFKFGLYYGIFYPLNAMEHPESIYGSFAAEPKFAQTIQTHLIIKF